jgi:c-di-GMP-binding flagellar brake protein YcgR
VSDGADGEGPRRHERYPIRVPVYITALDGTTLHKLLPLESKDISVGGLSFETSRKVPLEAESRVVVSKLRDLKAEALIRGRVAHREKDPKTGRYTIGIEFTGFVGVTREELVSCIDAWRR